MAKNIDIPDGWEVKKLGEVVLKSFYGTSEPTKKNGKYPVLKMANLDNGKIILSNIEFIDLTDEEYNRIRLIKNDILFNRTNSEELVGKIAIFDLDINCVVASYIVVFRINQNISLPLYINFLLNTYIYRNNIKQYISKGVSQCNINQNTLKKHLDILLPPLAEQKKIAEILSLWDKAIQQTKELITYKEKYKKGLMQKLLTGKKRLNGFNDEWKIVKLGEVLKERNIYADKNSKYEHVSLTKDGIIPKNERYNRDFLVTKDNKQYKVTKLNDICYNPANLKFGVICKNNYGIGIFSPIYVTFEINNIYNVDFIANILTQPNFINKIRRYEEGTVYERKAVKSNDFLLGCIYVTTLNEQKAIANILCKADKEIELLNKQLNLYTEQKKGLMQNLLTGKVRV